MVSWEERGQVEPKKSVPVPVRPEGSVPPMHPAGTKLPTGDVPPGRCVVCGEATEQDTHSTCGSKECDERVGPYGTVRE